MKITIPSTVVVVERRTIKAKKELFLPRTLMLSSNIKTIMFPPTKLPLSRYNSFPILLSFSNKRLILYYLTTAFSV